MICTYRGIPPSLGWTQIVSDLITFLAYFAIPVEIMVFRRRNEQLPFGWVLQLFQAFILSCGCTHLVQAIVPFYHVDAGAKGGDVEEADGGATAVLALLTLIKVLTAVVSALTATLLVRVIPIAFNFTYHAQEVEVELENTRKFGDSLSRANEKSAMFRYIVNKLRMTVEPRDLLTATSSELVNFLDLEASAVFLPCFVTDGSSRSGGAASAQRQPAPGSVRSGPAGGAPPYMCVAEYFAPVAQNRNASLLGQTLPPGSGLLDDVLRDRRVVELSYGEAVQLLGATTLTIPASACVLVMRLRLPRRRAHARPGNRERLRRALRGAPDESSLQNSSHSDGGPVHTQNISAIDQAVEVRLQRTERSRTEDSSSTASPSSGVGANVSGPPSRSSGAGSGSGSRDRWGQRVPQEATELSSSRSTGSQSAYSDEPTAREIERVMQNDVMGVLLHEWFPPSDASDSEEEEKDAQDEEGERRREGQEGREDSGHDVRAEGRRRRGTGHAGGRSERGASSRYERYAIVVMHRGVGPSFDSVEKEMVADVRDHVAAQLAKSFLTRQERRRQRQRRERETLEEIRAHVASSDHGHMLEVVARELCSPLRRLMVTLGEGEEEEAAARLPPVRSPTTNATARQNAEDAQMRERVRLALQVLQDVPVVTRDVIKLVHARKMGTRYTAQGILWDETIVGSPAHDLFLMTAQPTTASVQPLLPLVAAHVPVIVLGHQALPSRLVRMVAGVGRVAGAPTRRQPVQVTVRLWRPSDAARLASSRNALVTGQCVVTVARRASSQDAREEKRTSTSSSSFSPGSGSPMEGRHREVGRTDAYDSPQGRRRRHQRQSTASSSSRSNLAVAVIPAPGASDHVAVSSWPSMQAHADDGGAGEDSRSQSAAAMPAPGAEAEPSADDALYRELQALQEERRAKDFHTDALPFVISRTRPLHVGAQVPGLEQAVQAASSSQLGQMRTETPSPPEPDAKLASTSAGAGAQSRRVEAEWKALLAGQGSGASLARTLQWRSPRGEVAGASHAMELARARAGSGRGDSWVWLVAEAHAYTGGRDILGLGSALAEGAAAARGTSQRASRLHRTGRRSKGSDSRCGDGAQERGGSMPTPGYHPLLGPVPTSGAASSSSPSTSPASGTAVSSGGAPHPLLGALPTSQSALEGSTHSEPRTHTSPQRTELPLLALETTRRLADALGGDMWLEAHPAPSRRGRGLHAVTTVVAVPCCLPRGRESEAFSAPPPFARAWVVAAERRADAVAQQALAAGCMTRVAPSLVAAAQEAVACKAARAHEAAVHAQPPSAGGVAGSLTTGAAQTRGQAALPEIIVCDLDALQSPPREAEWVSAVVERLGIPVVVASQNQEEAEEAVRVSVAPPSGVQWVEWPVTKAALASVCRRLLGLAQSAQ